MTLFAAVDMAPRDPILGLNEQFNADTNPAKVNLGVGVYFGEDGKPRDELFVEDKLHQNSAGYKQWAAIIKKQLDADLGSVSPPK